MTTETDPINQHLTKARADAMLIEAREILDSTTVPAEAAKQRAVLRDLEGVRIFKGAESILTNNLNAHDHVTSLGWSYMPTLEWRAAQNS